MRSHVLRPNWGCTISHAPAHIMPTAEASTVASASWPGRLPLTAVKPHVSSTTNAAGGAEATSTAMSAPAHRRSIHAVAAQNARLPVPGVIFARLCASPY